MCFRNRWVRLFHMDMPIFLNLTSQPSCGFKQSELKKLSGVAVLFGSGDGGVGTSHD